MNTWFYRSLVLDKKCGFCKTFKSERVLDPQIISHVLTPVFHLHHVSRICLHLFFLRTVFIATFSHWLRLIMEALLSAYTYMWSVWKHRNEERNPRQIYIYIYEQQYNKGIRAKDLSIVENAIYPDIGIMRKLGFVFWKRVGMDETNKLWRMWKVENTRCHSSVFDWFFLPNTDMQTWLNIPNWIKESLGGNWK